MCLCTDDFGTQMISSIFDGFSYIIMRVWNSSLNLLKLDYIKILITPFPFYENLHNKRDKGRIKNKYPLITLHILNRGYGKFNFFILRTKFKLDKRLCIINKTTFALFFTPTSSKVNVKKSTFSIFTLKDKRQKLQSLHFYTRM